MIRYDGPCKADTDGDGNCPACAHGQEKPLCRAYDDPRIALYDTYQGQGNPLCIEDGNDWKELRLSELVALVVAEYRRQERTQ